MCHSKVVKATNCCPGGEIDKSKSCAEKAEGDNFVFPFVLCYGHFVAISIALFEAFPGSSCPSKYTFLP